MEEKDLEKVKSILEGVLERHECKKNVGHVYIGPPTQEYLDAGYYNYWNKCSCEECKAIKKALKKLEQ